MAWLLFPNGRILENDDPLRGHQLGDEVQHSEIMRLTPRPTTDQVQARQAARPRQMPRSALAEIQADLSADTRPAILISRTEDADAPDQLRQLSRNVTCRAGRMSPARNFARFQQHYNDHRTLLEKANGRSYPHLQRREPSLVNAFLGDLGRLITSGYMRLIGAATISKTENLVYVFRGKRLTCMMTPSGIWVTLIKEGVGLDRGLLFHLRFDKAHPFAYPGYGRTGG